MKPFNLELAKAGHPVQTRDGRPVRIVCYDVDNNESPILALAYFDGKEFPYMYDRDGFSCRNNRNLDLVMVSTKQEMWINIYRNSAGEIRIGANYKSELNALENISNKECYICTKKVEWEE